MTPGVVFETNFPKLKFLKRGKVRDIYDIGDHLLIVATDRLSAFDVVMPQPIPFKGKVLTQLSNFWFKRIGATLPNHLVATRVEEFPVECREYADELRGRSVVVKKTVPLAIECVARGYLAGSGWNEYRSTGAVCGVELPPGLQESSRLPAPIFTPATKAEEGHDENIPYERAEEIVGKELARKVLRHTLTIYEAAAEYARSRGIIIADTKMEFGISDGVLILIDELLTPDSSRFWPAAAYAPGKSQESFDKQYVRDYLISIQFNRQAPGPVMPEEVIQKTTELYREALIKLTGSDVE